MIGTLTDVKSYVNGWSAPGREAEGKKKEMEAEGTVTGRKRR